MQNFTAVIIIPVYILLYIGISCQSLFIMRDGLCPMVDVLMVAHKTIIMIIVIRQRYKERCKSPPRFTKQTCPAPPESIVFPLHLTSCCSILQKTYRHCVSIRRRHLRTYLLNSGADHNISHVIPQRKALNKACTTSTDA